MRKTGCAHICHSFYSSEVLGSGWCSVFYAGIGFAYLYSCCVFNYQNL